MRRPRFRKPEQSMSLFPFLAVLICTVGVLVILLVVVTKHADVQAQEGKQADLNELDKEQSRLTMEKDEQVLRATMLTQARPSVTADLETERLKRSHLQQHIGKVKNDILLLEKQLAHLAETQDDQDDKKLAEQFAATQSQLAVAQVELEAAKKANSQRTPSYTIVPYQGKNGTRRRPIYIECTQEGIVLQPFGITLNIDDFTDPVVSGNPLDAAMLMVREYWQRYGDLKPGEEPYPLLVVRPEGTAHYALARKAMKSWDYEFGYELVEAETKLDFPGDDPLLEKRLREIIEEAKRRQVLVAHQQAVLSRQRGQQDGASRFASNSSRRGFGRGAGGVGSRGGSAGDADSEEDGGTITLRATAHSGGFIRKSGGSQSGESFLNDNQYSTPRNSGGNANQSSSRQNSSNPNGNGQSDASQSDSSQSNSSQGHTAKNASGSDLQRNSSFRPQGDHSNDSQSQADSAGQATHSSASRVSENAAAGQGNASTGGATSCLAESRGTNWALPSKTPGATAFHRPIRITCTKDYLIIEPPQRSRIKREVVSLGPHTEENIDELVDLIWKRIESWGLAGYNAYWVPDLKLGVVPGGEQRFNNLKVLLDQSGFELEATAQ